MKAHTYNKNTFSVPTVDSCYLAGLIASDGNLYHHTNLSYRFSIGFKESDKDFLEKFKQKVNFSGPLNLTTRNLNNKIFLGYRIYLSGIQNDWLSDLNKYWNITPKKSLTLEPPNLIETEHKLSYICGYLDGDGSISITKNTYNKKDIIMLSFVGTRNFLSWIGKTIFQTENNKNYIIPKIIQKSSKNKSFQLSYNNNRAYNILKELEKIPTPFKLERKWNKIKEYEKLKGIT